MPRKINSLLDVREEFVQMYSDAVDGRLDTTKMAVRAKVLGGIVGTVKLYFQLCVLSDQMPSKEWTYFISGGATKQIDVPSSSPSVALAGKTPLTPRRIEIKEKAKEDMRHLMALSDRPSRKDSLEVTDPEEQ